MPLTVRKSSKIFNHQGTKNTKMLCFVIPMRLGVLALVVHLPGGCPPAELSATPRRSAGAILQQDPLIRQFLADAVRLGEILRPAGSDAPADQIFDRGIGQGRPAAGTQRNHASTSCCRSRAHRRWRAGRPSTWPFRPDVTALLRLVASSCRWATASGVLRSSSRAARISRGTLLCPSAEDRRRCVAPDKGDPMLYAPVSGRPPSNRSAGGNAPTTWPIESPRPVPGPKGRARCRSCQRFRHLLALDHQIAIMQPITCEGLSMLLELLHKSMASKICVPLTLLELMTLLSAGP